MYQFCFTINGHRHCFNVPTLIDKNVIRKPPVNNLPPFELAASVLLLVEAVPVSPLAIELTQIATRYIQDLAKGMPKGVELVAGQAEHAAA